MPEEREKVGRELVVWCGLPNALPMHEEGPGSRPGSSGSSLAWGAQLGPLIGPSSLNPFRSRSEALRDSKVGRPELGPAQSEAVQIPPECSYQIQQQITAHVYYVALAWCRKYVVGRRRWTYLVSLLQVQLDPNKTSSESIESGYCICTGRNRGHTHTSPARNQHPRPIHIPNTYTPNLNNYQVCRCWCMGVRYVGMWVSGYGYWVYGCWVYGCVGVGVWVYRCWVCGC